MSKSAKELLKEINTLLNDILVGTTKRHEYEIRMSVEDLEAIRNVLAQAAERENLEEKLAEMMGGIHSKMWEDVFSSARSGKEQGSFTFEDLYNSAFRNSSFWSDQFGESATQQEARRRQTEEELRRFWKERPFGRGPYTKYNHYTYEEASRPPPKQEKPKRPWYEVLGLRPGATKSQINNAYRSLAMRFHPDRKGGSHEKMSEINVARNEGLAGL